MAAYEQGRAKKHREAAGKRWKGGRCQASGWIQRGPRVSSDSTDDSKGHKGPCRPSGSAHAGPTTGREAGSRCTDFPQSQPSPLSITNQAKTLLGLDT